MNCAAPDCSAVLGPKNATGFCRKHFSSHCPRPERGARISASRKRFLQENPAEMTKIRDLCRTIAKLPQTRAAGSRNARKNRLWEIGQAALTPEARKLAGQRARATKLAWCPENLREAYLHLLYSSRIKKTEAKALILAEHEASLRKMRREMGATEPVQERPIPAFRAEGTGDGPGWSERVGAIRAERARIDDLRQQRTLCSICGARSDIGCEHGAAA